jgi:hypothetical protein
MLLTKELGQLQVNYGLQVIQEQLHNCLNIFKKLPFYQAYGQYLA